MDRPSGNTYVAGQMEEKELLKKEKKKGGLSKEQGKKLATYETKHAKFVNVQINELLRVIELDSGPSPANGDDVVPREAPTSTETQMAIVIPCPNEYYHTIEGVLMGIPYDCLGILVSKNSRFPVDR
ncbi:Uu.00g057060.m01.CDS01 [Anthostomella pinea]|uniref:Uu.00g057060.m01.CDS01 n=1 Tax=Anthostomella pinea TaxID=933095 RepID=A0AAI8VRJ1_9PEZI|nr:Uu.00g057060.m01.CDS01 [Anthostomella pinea]